VHHGGTHLEDAAAMKLGFGITLGIALGCAGCGDDESARGSGGAGGEDPATTSSTGSPSSSDATSGSSGSTSSSTSTGGADACPEDVPSVGAACAVEGTCHYEEEAVCEDGSMVSAAADATCTDGEWVVDLTFEGECCPDVPLQSGFLPCSIEGKICTYEGDVVCEGGGAIGGNVVATCDGSTYQTVYEPTGGTCQGQTTCPSAPPSSGSACDLEVQTLDCIWERASTCPDGAGFNVITVANCHGASGHWSVATFFEGTECPACAEQELSCETEGLACTIEQEVADIEWCGGSGVIVTGSVCEDGVPQAKWDLPICD
jgi:hypothetical protein